MCSEQRSVCENVELKYLCMIPTKHIPKFISCHTKSLVVKNPIYYNFYEYEKDIWKFIHRCSRLEKLKFTLKGMRQLDILSSKLSTIRELSIDCHLFKNQDISCLGKLLDLEFLEFGCNNNDISFIAKLPKLHTLILDKIVVEEEDLTVFSKLEIRNLSLISAWVTYDNINKILENTNLRSLKISFDMWTLVASKHNLLPNLLEELTVTVNCFINSVENLGWLLAQFPKLTTLHIDASGYIMSSLMCEKNLEMLVKRSLKKLVLGKSVIYDRT